MYTIFTELQSQQKKAFEAGISFSIEYDKDTFHDKQSLKASFDYTTNASDINDRRVFSTSFDFDDDIITNEQKLATLSNSLSQAIESKQMFESITRTDNE